MLSIDITAQNIQGKNLIGIKYFLEYVSIKNIVPN